MRGYVIYSPKRKPETEQSEKKKKEDPYSLIFYYQFLRKSLKYFRFDIQITAIVIDLYK